MSKKDYNKEQIDLLKANKYVKDCTSKYITFIDELKTEALKLDNKWVYFRDIFRHFWFPDFIVDSDVPKQILKNWRYNMRKKWLLWLVSTKKWRKKWEEINISKMTQEEKIIFLETENAYLKELYKTTYWHYP